MILSMLIFLPFVGGILAWIAGSRNKPLSRWIALIFLFLQLLGLLSLKIGMPSGPGFFLEYNIPWIIPFGINYHLGMDGLSFLLALLTSFLGIISVAASWKGIQERVGFYHFMLLWIITAIMGIFLSLDLFLFYFFWEMMLIPLYFLIGIWGHENRIYAALKFFIFTQASSLLMLLSILGFYFINAQTSGVYTFDYNIWVNSVIPTSTAIWLSLGFLAAFLVKLPAVPFHSWLPDAHTEAPTAGSIILAGLVLKVGAYGLLRFSLPLFPEASKILAPWLMALGVIGIVYGSLEAFGQTDFKRLVAFTSVSHMGFVLVGIYAGNLIALQGVVIVMLAHGITTGALFVLAGDLQDLIHTREMGQMGGLWSTIPRFAGISQLFALASLGLPGLGNFVGEFLVLLGAYQANITITVVATLGFIVSTVYALWMIQRVFHGPNRHNWKLPDISTRQALILGSLIVLIVWLGLFPQGVINTARPALESIHQMTTEQTHSQTLPALADSSILEKSSSDPLFRSNP